AGVGPRPPVRKRSDVGGVTRMGPGLSLGFGGQAGVRAKGQANYGQGSGPASTSAGAFGQGSSVTPSGAQTLAPNDPVGVALWASVGAVAFLALTRHSLPANMKRIFDLDLMVLVGGHLAAGVVRMENRRL